MRTGILLLLAIMSLATVKADNINKSTSKIGVTNRYNEAITFVERGIQFHVFLNGDFDFNTHARNTKYVDYYGRRTKVNRGVRIERDYNGRVRRVGNTFINYDARGNVKRIGTVYMRYRYGQLTNVGNLNIRYDRWGNPRYYGNVKYNNEYCGDNSYYNNGLDVDINIDIFDYNDTYFYRRDFRNNYRKYKEDNNFYYYRAKPNAKIGKRSKILKRRKSKNYSKNSPHRKMNPEQKGRSKRNR